MKNKLILLSTILLLIMVSGCMTQQAFGKGPVMSMDSGILVNRKTYKVPWRDAANVMVFSPDNRYLLATGTYAKHINIYDLETGKIVKRFLKRDDENNWRVSPKGYFSSDSRYLILRDNNLSTKEGYHVVDMKTFEVIKLIVPERIGGDIEFSKDGKYFALGGGGSLTNNPKFYGKKPVLGIYDAKTWKLISNIKKGYGPDEGVRFTPDTQYLIDIGKLGNDYTREKPQLIRFWSVPELKLVRTIDGFFTGDSSIFSMELSHKGQILAVSASSLAEGLQGKLFIDLETGKVRHEYRGMGGRNTRFSAHDRYVLMGQSDERYLISILDTQQDFKLVERVTHAETSRVGESTAFSSDGTKAALSSGRKFYVWDINVREK